MIEFACGFIVGGAVVGISIALLVSPMLDKARLLISKLKLELQHRK